MAFGKAVAAKPLDLLVAPFGEAAFIATRHHPADQLFVKLVHAADMVKRRHGAAELVGFERGKVGSDNGELHRLFLEQWDTMGLAKQGPQLVRIMRRLEREGNSAFSMPDRRRNHNMAACRRQCDHAINKCVLGASNAYVDYGDLARHHPVDGAGNCFCR